MAYTPNTWESGDVVTATKLNSLEQAVGELNMSYTPNNWSDGDVLSAAKMNALEQAVASGGGGGGGDFETAQVSVILGNDLYFEAYCSQTVDDMIPPTTSYSYSSNEPGTYTISIILYKGSANLGIDTNGSVSVSGNIFTVFEGELYSVYGDCTITIS